MKENGWAIEALNQIWIAEAHDADYPWECPNCRKLYKTIGKSI